MAKEYTLDQLQNGYRKALDAGDQGAAEVLRGQILATQKREQGRAVVGDMNTAERLAAGMGQGLVNTAKNVGDIVGRVPGLGFMRPDAEKWKEERELSKPLLDTTSGKVGNFLGETVATLPIGGGAAAGGKAVAANVAPKLLAKLAKPMGQAMVSGSAAGAVLAGPENRGAGAAMGAALPYGLGKVGGLVRKGYQGLVKPSDSARFLEGKGVDLSLSQKNPRSLIGQMETLAADVPGFRQLIKGRQNAAKDQIQHALLNESRAPGQAMLNPAAAIDDKLAANYHQGFGRAYSEVFEGEMIYPAIHKGGKGMALQGTKNKPGALLSAAQDKQVLATKYDREAVSDFLENQLTLLNGGPLRKVAVSKLPATTIQTMRENVRAASRDTSNKAQRKLLENADQVLTDVLESQMPKKAAKLREIDNAYVRYKTMESAVRKGRDAPDGFTFKQASNAIADAADDGAYARGEMGPLAPLRDITKAAATIESDMATTGIRAVPLAISAPITLPMSLFAATKVGNKLLTGGTSGQKKLQVLEDQLRRRILQAGGPGALEEGAVGAGTLANTGLRGRE